MKMNNIKICTNIKDSTGKEYCIGDIVHNTYFGDYWLVESYNSNKYAKPYQEECPYLLSLNGNAKDYFIDLSEPSGFKIVCRIGDTDYKGYIQEFKRIKRRIFISEMSYKFRHLIYKPISALGRFSINILKGVYDNELESTNKKR